MKKSNDETNSDGQDKAKKPKKAKEPKDKASPKPKKADQNPNAKTQPKQPKKEKVQKKKERKAKEERLFAGKSSKFMWRAIGKVRKQRKRKKLASASNDALYNLALTCQRLEEQVSSLKGEVTRLKGNDGEPKDVRHY
jgi:hypothetical protein